MNKEGSQLFPNCSDPILKTLKTSMENSYNWETYSSSVSGHKIKTQKSVAFLSTNNEFVQKQIKKKINKSRKITLL